MSTAGCSAPTAKGKKATNLITGIRLLSALGKALILIQVANLLAGWLEHAPAGGEQWLQNHFTSGNLAVTLIGLLLLIGGSSSEIIFGGRAARAEEKRLRSLLLTQIITCPPQLLNGLAKGGHPGHAAHPGHPGGSGHPGSNAHPTPAGQSAKTDPLRHPGSATANKPGAKPATTAISTPVPGAAEAAENKHRQLGQAVNLLTDSVERMTEYRQNYYGSARAALMIPLLTLIYVAVRIDWVVGVSEALFCLLIPVALILFMRAFRKTSANSRRERARLSAKYLDAIRNLTLIRLFGAGDRVAQYLAGEGEKNRRAIMRLLAGNQLVIILVDGLFSLLLLVMTGVLVTFRGGQGALSLSGAIQILFLLVLLLEPLSQVAGFFYIGMGGKAAERAIKAQLKPSKPNSGGTGLVTGEEPTLAGETETEGAAPSAENQTGILLQEVSYDYGRGTVLNRVNLTVKPGMRIGIIGPSGSGKSTLLGVLSGQLSPTGGKVTTDPSQIAIVSQNTWLFTGTIRDNLQLVNPQADDAAIWQALEQANLAPEIRNLPEQLDTQLGEEGTRLSGGQAQRLSLARALLSARPILLLDEPTSQIDHPSQQQLLSALQNLGPQYTIVLITHRVELLTLVNQCYRLNTGQLIETDITRQQQLKKTLPPETSHQLKGGKDE